MGKDFTDDIAFQAANDLTFAFSVFGAFLDICEGRFVTSHPDNCDPIQSGVRLSVSAAIEPDR